MNKTELIKTLQSGICELTWTDRHSVEHSAMVTMAQHHLPDESEPTPEDKLYTIVAFNVNTEQWETFSVPSVIDIEQLTGDGALNNEKKLQASSEYIESLFGNTYDDLDAMEHPEL